jgi:hypothetical protein
MTELTFGKRFKGENRLFGPPRSSEGVKAGHVNIPGMKIHYKRSVQGAFIGLILWFLEPVIDCLAQGNPTTQIAWLPNDPYDLWVRTLIAIAFPCFGLYLDQAKRSLHRLDTETRKAYEGTITTCSLIVNRFVCQRNMLTDQMKCDSVSRKEIVRSFDRITQEATGMLKKIENIPTISSKSILRCRDLFKANYPSTQHKTEDT